MVTCMLPSSQNKYVHAAKFTKLVRMSDSTSVHKSVAWKFIILYKYLKQNLLPYDWTKFMSEIVTNKRHHFI
jgi:hypothetical protein